MYMIKSKSEIMFDELKSAFGNDADDTVCCLASIDIPVNNDNVILKDTPVEIMTIEKSVTCWDKHRVFLKTLDDNRISFIEFSSISDVLIMFRRDADLIGISHKYYTLCKNYCNSIESKNNDLTHLGVKPPMLLSTLVFWLATFLLLCCMLSNYNTLVFYSCLLFDVLASTLTGFIFSTEFMRRLTLKREITEQYQQLGTVESTYRTMLSLNPVVDNSEEVKAITTAIQ